MRKPEEVRQKLRKLLDLIQQSENPEDFINQVSYEELKLFCRFLESALKEQHGIMFKSPPDETQEIFQTALNFFQHQLKIRRDLNWTNRATI